jgi:benzoyl-CoA 2,3-dioxygenase component B
VLEKGGAGQRLRLPHKAFHRQIGTFEQVHVSPDGRVLAEAEWTRHHADWLPNDADHAFVQSLMKPVTEPGKFASWIAPPARGINNQPIEFTYARVD